MGLTYRDIADILEIIDKSSCEELIVEVGDTKLVVRRHGRTGSLTGAGVPDAAPPAAAPPAAVSPAAVSPAAVSPAAAPAQPAPAAAGAPAPASPGTIQVRAPMVGTFYRRPSPGEPPFVSEGDVVAEGDPLCLIEVMKLYTTLEAPTAGRITWIGPEDAALVAHDAVLFVIEPG